MCTCIDCLMNLRLLVVVNIVCVWFRIRLHIEDTLIALEFLHFSLCLPQYTIMLYLNCL